MTLSTLTPAQETAYQTYLAEMRVQNAGKHPIQKERIASRAEWVAMLSSSVVGMFNEDSDR